MSGKTTRAKARARQRAKDERQRAQDARSPAPAPPGRDRLPKIVLACGDFGGRNADGTKCAHPAGWGKGRDEGQCVEHDPDADATLQGLKKRLLDELAVPTRNLVGACLQIGRDPSTVWRWRVADPEFDEAVAQACSNRDALRVHLADDAIFGRILSGESSAASEIFWLKNKAPNHFRDRHEVTGANGSPLAQVHTMMFGGQEITF
jgi:hypothetical protein